MKVLVIGLGIFGFSLVDTLLKEGVEVLAIDNHENNIELIKNKVSMALTLDAKNKEDLKVLPLKELDHVIVCIGDDMESSILATLHLKQLGVSHVVARATSKHHDTILKAIGADEVIFLEQDAGERLARKLVKGHVFNYIPLSDDHVIVEVIPTQNMIGKKLGELRLRQRFNINVVAIKQKVASLSENNENIFEEKIIDVPMADYELSEKDILIVVGSSISIEKFKEEIQS